MKTALQAIGNIAGTWSSQYDDERWKSFARSIRRERGNFCECCKQSNKEIHVHHFSYEKDKPIWESDAEDVALLCRECHQSLHSELRNFRRFVFRKLSPQSFRVFNAALKVGLDFNDPLKLAYAFAEMASRRDAAWIELEAEKQKQDRQHED
jgi:hypothetical protein